MGIERAVVIVILVLLALVVLVFALNFIDDHTSHAVLLGIPGFAAVLSRLR